MRVQVKLQVYELVKLAARILEKCPPSSLFLPLFFFFFQFGLQMWAVIQVLTKTF